MASGYYTTSTCVHLGYIRGAIRPVRVLAENPMRACSHSLELSVHMRPLVEVLSDWLKS